jgi:hypothetical protein
VSAVFQAPLLVLEMVISVAPMLYTAVRNASRHSSQSDSRLTHGKGDERGVVRGNLVGVGGDLRVKGLGVVNELDASSAK